MATAAGFLLLFAFTLSMVVLVPLALVPLAGVALWAARRSRDAGTTADAEAPVVVRDAPAAAPSAGTVRAA